MARRTYQHTLPVHMVQLFSMPLVHCPETIMKHTPRAYGATTFLHASGTADHYKLSWPGGHVNRLLVLKPEKLWAQ